VNRLWPLFSQPKFTSKPSKKRKKRETSGVGFEKNYQTSQAEKWPSAGCEKAIKRDVVLAVLTGVRRFPVL
jgi:hypothetical protein